MSRATVLGNGTVITGWERPAVVQAGAVAWRDDRIVAVGPEAEVREAHPGAGYLDAGGGLILPGLVNLHHHFYSSLARGLDPGAEMRDFPEILDRLWWRLDRALDPDTVRLSALLAAAECVRWGCTTVFDHHASPSCIDGSLDVLAGDRDAAVEELQSIASSGFPAVNVIIGDPLLGSLEGHPGYDTVVGEMSVKAFPCEHDELFSEFDFWVGSWDVHIAGGGFAGNNVIDKSQHGCVLTENWSSAGGGTGTSINYVDKITGEWVQIWNDASGGQINIRGGMTDDGMLLSGTIHTVADGKTLPFRGLWTPLPDGRVRQFFEQSSDEGATWTPWFEGFYTRSPAE